MSNPAPTAAKVESKPTATGGVAQRKQISAKSAVLKDYRQRLKDNVRSLRENFQEIIRLARVNTFHDYLSIIVPSILTMIHN